MVMTIQIINTFRLLLLIGNGSKQGFTTTRTQPQCPATCKEECWSQHSHARKCLGQRFQTKQAANNKLPGKCSAVPSTRSTEPGGARVRPSEQFTNGGNGQVGLHLEDCHGTQLSSTRNVQLNICHQLPGTAMNQQHRTTLSVPRRPVQAGEQGRWQKTGWR